MIYYEIREKRSVFEQIRWEAVCFYIGEAKAKRAFNTIKNKGDYKLVKVTEEILEGGENE